jgi:hypothetical protein
MVFLVRSFTVCLCLIASQVAHAGKNQAADGSVVGHAVDAWVVDAMDAVLPGVAACGEWLSTDRCCNNNCNYAANFLNIAFDADASLARNVATAARAAPALGNNASLSTPLRQIVSRRYAGREVSMNQVVSTSHCSACSTQGGTVNNAACRTSTRCGSWMANRRWSHRRSCNIRAFESFQVALSMLMGRRECMVPIVGPLAQHNLPHSSRVQRAPITQHLSMPRAPYAACPAILSPTTRTLPFTVPFEPPHHA